MDPITLVLVAVVVIMLIKPNALGSLFGSSSPPTVGMPLQAPPAAQAPPVQSPSDYAAQQGIEQALCQSLNHGGGDGQYQPYSYPTTDNHGGYLYGSCFVPAAVDPKLAFGSCPDRVSCQGAPRPTVQLGNPSPPEPAPTVAVQQIQGATRAGALFPRTGLWKF